MTDWYKIVRPDGTDWYSGTLSYLTNDVITAPDYQATSDCGRGLHLSPTPNGAFVAGARLPCRLLRVEPIDGLVALGETKSKCRSLRVLDEIRDLNAALGWDYRGAVECLATLYSYPWLQPDGHPDPTWHLSTAQTWATAREAARSAAWEAAWEAAMEAAMEVAWRTAREAAIAVADATAWRAAGETAMETAGSAAGHAAMEAAIAVARATAREAAGETAMETAGEAAWMAVAGEAAREATAREAAMEAAGDAAWSAALYISLRYICDGIDLAPAHLAHAEARMAVWRQGYGLYGDVHGVLYVYAAP
jgi:hypothetical protein